MVTLRLFGNDKKPLRCQDLQRLHLKLANKCDKGRQNGWASHFLGGQQVINFSCWTFCSNSTLWELKATSGTCKYIYTVHKAKHKWIITTSKDRGMQYPSIMGIQWRQLNGWQSTFKEKWDRTSSSWAVGALLSRRHEVNQFMLRVGRSIPKMAELLRLVNYDYLSRCKLNDLYIGNLHGCSLTFLWSNHSKGFQTGILATLLRMYHMADWCPSGWLWSYLPYMFLYSGYTLFPGRNSEFDQTYPSTILSDHLNIVNSVHLFQCANKSIRDSEPFPYWIILKYVRHSLFTHYILCTCLHYSTKLGLVAYLGHRTDS